MPPFRSLKVWQHAQRLAAECGRAAKRFPDVDQKVLAGQLLRASTSVPLNIAEGSARKGSKEFRRYLDIARGSLAEVESALDLARELEYIDATEYARLDALRQRPLRLFGACYGKSETPRRATLHPNY